MAKLTEELLGRYVDGELPNHENEKIKKLIDASPDDVHTVHEWTRVGSLLRLMDEETTADVSFEGLSDKILAEIKTTRASLSITEKLKTWFAEFIEHRRAVWIPASVAVSAVSLALAVLPVLNSSRLDRPAPPQDQGIALHSAVSAKGSRITAVDFGTETGMQYALDDGTGSTVGVVWIVEN